MAAVPALRIDGLRIEGAGGRLLLEVADFHLAPGRSVALRGASGAGKSTLLHAMSGLLRPAAGRVLWGDIDIAALPEAERTRFRRERLGLVFQDFLLFEELDALGNAAIGATFASRPARAPIRARAAGWLSRLGLGDAGRRKVASFSGGERQRIAVARALAGDPAVILADEPTASLDRAAADRLGADLARLAREDGRTLIAVTHDTALAARLDRAVTLADGRIVEDSDG